MEPTQRCPYCISTNLSHLGMDAFGISQFFCHDCMRTHDLSEAHLAPVESARQALYYWLDEMEDSGQLTPEEHDALEESICEANF